MARFWHMRGDIARGGEWLAQLLNVHGARGSTIARARAFAASGYLAIFRGDDERAALHLETSRAHWLTLGETRGLAACLFFLGVHVGWSGRDWDRCVGFLSEALALARDRGPRWVAYSCMICVAEVARARGDFETAQRLLLEARALAETNGDRWGGAYSRIGLGLVALKRAEAGVAKDHFRAGLVQALELDHDLAVSYALDGLGSVASIQGHPERAARLFGAAHGVRQPIGDFMAASFRFDLDTGVALAREQWGTAAFEAAWRDGAAMSRDEAAGYALADVHTTLTAV
jgi:non-specific serine/threonine protein kinase